MTPNEVKQQPRLLVCDDDPEVLKTLKRWVEAFYPDYQVEHCSTVSEALDAIALIGFCETVSLIIDGTFEKTMDGNRVAERVVERAQELGREIPFGRHSGERESEIEPVGRGFLQKPPANPNDLPDFLAKLLA